MKGWVGGCDGLSAYLLCPQKIPQCFVIGSGGKTQAEGKLPEAAGDAFAVVLSHGAGGGGHERHYSRGHLHTACGNYTERADGITLDQTDCFVINLAPSTGP